MQANGEDPGADPAATPGRVWRIPFDRLVSLVPRLQPRYYSISSSPKLYPNSVHVTVVVLKYQAGLKGEEVTPTNAKFIYGTASNYLLNLRLEQGLQHPQRQLRAQPDLGNHVPAPKYKLGGPRDAYLAQGVLRVPIHVRSSNFRLPANVKLPVIMVGPGTGVAPFRGFLQERVALAQEAKKIYGPDALRDWGEVVLFYGCRSPSSDYLYSEEWSTYAQELDGKFKMFTAFSRVKGKPKVYVQHLISEERKRVEEAIIGRKGYVYICGDAGHMAKDVEDVLREVLARGKPSEGEREFQLLKSEGRLHLDVW
jgi:NADPH-ferrihemoprotein reductase